MAVTSLTEVFRRIFAAERPKDVTKASKPAQTVDPLVAMGSQLSEGAAFFWAFKHDVEPFAMPSQMVSSHGVHESGVEYLRLANGAPTASSALHTGGYGIRLPDAVEAAASGRHITVRIAARAAGGGHSRFAVAYSTNDVGNSGWRWFEADAEWSVYSTEWDVPVMRNGNGDFLGILPDAEGTPGTEICYLAINIA